ncbi:hypothetical protein IWW37_001117 [Coemansia sp. RSA 2050]|nr:hypothetical protein IWW37_001117 [Coemansia sp. RSA 2050]KAJ2733224.1 hypothetical protein IW152_003223 [Coemansia sp. BCRC 34962]
MATIGETQARPLTQMERLTTTQQACNNTVAGIVHQQATSCGEYCCSLDPAYYEMVPILACALHTGRPVATGTFNRALQAFFINNDRVYKPPELHPVYVKAYGITFVSHDKDICALAEIFALGLKPIDELLTSLPILLDRDPDVGKLIRDHLGDMNHILYQAMTLATEQRNKHIIAQFRAAPTNYDKTLITDP